MKFTKLFPAESIKLAPILPELTGLLHCGSSQLVNITHIWNQVILEMKRNHEELLIRS